MRKLDVIGKTFNRLTVLSDAPSGPNLRRVVCRCICGTEKTFVLNNIVRETTTSCGCVASEVTSRRVKTHGRTDTPEFYVWRTMKARCTNPKQPQWHRYGGRGIKICDRWLHSFQSFFEDMGERPSTKHSLDRINNDGPYEPSNCRWATLAEQNANRSTNVLITYQGVTLTMSDWARRVGLKPWQLWRRLDSGLDIETALTKPLQRKGMRQRIKALTPL